MNQVFSDHLPVAGEMLRLGGDERHYLGRVLRARTGELVRVADGLGHARVAVLRGFEGDHALLEIQRDAAEAGEAWAFHLGLCAPKGDALELALEAAVQMGVESITLLKSRRTQANFEGGALQPERLRRRLVEASRQCERSKVPFLLGPMSLEAYLDGARDGLRLVASERGGLPIAESVAGLSAGSAVHGLVGPEGGFEAAELEAAGRRAWQCITLGPRALKVPVAVAALYAVLRAVQPQSPGPVSGPWADQEL